MRILVPLVRSPTMLGEDPDVGGALATQSNRPESIQVGGGCWPQLSM